MNTNFIVNESAGEYHARNRSGEFMSSHLLVDFRESPAIYYKEMKGEIERQQKKIKKNRKHMQHFGGLWRQSVVRGL